MGGARLIALDWGSSALRAFLLGAGGHVLAARASADGASQLTGEKATFAQQLRGLIGDWLGAHPGVPVVACGMVGSKHGWREAPYAACPVALDELHAGAVLAEDGGDLRVWIVPGVYCAHGQGAPDVMRGEETQVCGLVAGAPRLASDCTVVLPGTHSKWVQLRGGRIETFATYMTGEVFALLRQHSVLGRLMQHVPVFDEAAFREGLRLSASGHGRDLLHDLFSVRSHGLFANMAPSALADYLSGLLIGAELASALRGAAGDAPLALAGDAALCARYRLALAASGRQVALVADNTAAQGLWQQASRADWLRKDAR